MSIGRKCGPAELLALGATCITWRAALGAAEEELWKALALRDFHRLRAILALSEPPASYLQLYREQSAVDASPLSWSVRKTMLSDFIFTVECSALPFAQGRKTIKRTFEWTGKLSRAIRCPETNESILVGEDGNAPRLPLDSDVIFPRSTSDRAFSKTLLKVYATHQLKTVKLYEQTLDPHALDDTFFALSMDAEGAHKDTLCFKDGELPSRFSLAQLHRGLPWWDDGSPRSLPMLALDLCCAGARRGEIAIIFVQEHFSFEYMSTEEIHGYLEHMVPWP